jgi:hypothetical protein
MKTFLRVAIATFAMVGIASAQPKTDPMKKDPPKADPKADTMKKDPPKADPKADMMKKDAPKDAPKMEMPKVPAEVAEMGKQVTGTWRCKGDEMGMTGEKTAVTATMKTKVDMDKWWITDNLEVKGKNTFKMMAFTTYDGASKKWRRVAVDNMGGQMVGTSDGMKDGKMDWNLDAIGPMGASMFRDHIDATDAKAGVKMWGEMSMDKGKTWAKVYEMSCKK